MSDFINNNSLNAKELNLILKCVVKEIMPNEEVNDLAKLILCWLVINGGESRQTNEDLGKIFQKSPGRISVTINMLIDANYVISSGPTSSRVLTINDSGDKPLYNYFYSITYSKSNNINKLYNKEHSSISIRESQIKGLVAIARCKGLWNYTVDSIIKELEATGAEEWNCNIKASSLGKAVVTSLNSFQNQEKLEFDFDSNIDYFEERFAKALMLFFKKMGFRFDNSLNEKRIKIERLEKESPIVANERRMDRYYERSWQEKLLPIKSKFQLQNCSIGDLVKVDGDLIEAYTGGSRTMCNYKIQLLNGDEVRAVMINEHVRSCIDDGKEYKDHFCRFEGKVVNNAFHGEKIIQSVKGHFPVKKINTSGILNTKLRTNDGIPDPPPF